MLTRTFCILAIISSLAGCVIAHKTTQSTTPESTNQICKRLKEDIALLPAHEAFDVTGGHTLTQVRLYRDYQEYGCQPALTANEN